MIPRSCIILLLLCLISCCVQYGRTIDNDYDDDEDDESIIEREHSVAKQIQSRRNYAIINDFLVHHTAKNDPQANMLITREWLRLEMTKSDNINKRLVESLNQLISLDQAMNRCSPDSYEIMRANDLATDQFAHKKIPPRRIDKIIAYYCKEHSKFCQSVHPDAYRTKYNLLDKEFMRRLEVFINNEAIEQVFDCKASSLREIYSKTINDNAITTIISNSAKKIASTESDEEVLARDYKLEELLQIYLLEPCQYYMEQLGREVFLAASYDATWNYDTDSRETNFYYGFARFRFCKVVVENAHFLLENLPQNVSDLKDQY